MDECTHIGLDVHKESIAVAVLRPGTSACEERVIPNTPEALRKLLSRYPDRTALRTCYEAGPTGYDTHRLLSSLGVPCEVIAPSLIPRRSGVRTKTDRTDARNLARLHRAGELTAVRVPSPAEEVAAYSRKAQCRLSSTYRKLAAKKRPSKAAVARELSGFVWGAMTGVRHAPHPTPVRPRTPCSR